jgi:hypothetical protein
MQMLRYIVPLPFMLKFSSDHVFSQEISGKTVLLRFLNPKVISIPPAHLMLTALGIDTESELTPDDLEQIRLYTNNIIRSYRLVTGETYNNGAITQVSNDQFLKLIFYAEIDERGNFTSKPRLIQFVKKLEFGVIEGEKYSEIAHLASSINLITKRSNDEILLQARSFLEQENYRNAVLEAVIALEITVSSIIRKKALEKGITEQETENFMTNVGLKSSIEIVLRLLVSESLPPEEVLQGCKGAITIRNDIVHRARSSVTQREAQDAIRNVELFINHVRHLLE